MELLAFCGPRLDMKGKLAFMLWTQRAVPVWILHGENIHLLSWAWVVFSQGIQHLYACLLLSKYVLDLSSNLYVWEAISIAEFAYAVQKLCVSALWSKTCSQWRLPQCERWGWTAIAPFSFINDPCETLKKWCPNFDLQNINYMRWFTKKESWDRHRWQRRMELFFPGGLVLELWQGAGRILKWRSLFCFIFLFPICLPWAQEG